MSYKETLAFFKALPEDQKRFGKSAYSDTRENCPCALGVLNQNLQHLDHSDQSAPIEDLYLESKVEPYFTNALDLTIKEAQELQDTNDRIGHCYTPQERYNMVLHWLSFRV